jgi:hypothetical protein
MDEERLPPKILRIMINNHNVRFEVLTAASMKFRILLGCNAV